MNGVVKQEPALVSAAVLWALTNVGALVVERWHWMGAEQWSTLTTALVPLVTAVVLLGGGWLLRRVVTPVWRWVEDEAPVVDEVVEQATGVDVGKVLAEAEAIYPTPAATSEEA